MLCVCSMLVGGNLSNATDTHANSKNFSQPITAY